MKNDLEYKVPHFKDGDQLSPASFYLAIAIGKELNFRYQHMVRLDKYIESYFTFSIKSYFTFFCKDKY